jgi:hypothetical protein
MKTDQDKIPEHLVGPKNASIGNITVEDLVWVGPNGEVNPDAILSLHGYGPDDPFASMLSEIIRGNPIYGRDDRERLETALSALIGTRRKRGMDEINRDYDLLLEIARRFFASFHQNGHVEPELADIIRDVVAVVPAGDERCLASEDSIRRRLRRKFNKSKDILLVRVTSEQNWDRMDVARSINTIVRQLGALTLPVG